MELLKEHNSIIFGYAKADYTAVPPDYNDRGITYKDIIDDSTDNYNGRIHGRGNVVLVALSNEGVKSYSVNETTGVLSYEDVVDLGSYHIGVWADPDDEYIYIVYQMGLSSLSMTAGGSFGSVVDTEAPANSVGPTGNSNFVFGASASTLYCYAKSGAGTLTLVDSIVADGSDPSGEIKQIHATETHVFVAAGVSGLVVIAVDGSGNLSYVTEHFDAAGQGSNGSYISVNYHTIANCIVIIRWVGSASIYSLSGSTLTQETYVPDVGAEANRGVWSDDYGVFISCGDGLGSKYLKLLYIDPDDLTSYTWVETLTGYTDGIYGVWSNSKFVFSAISTSGLTSVEKDLTLDKAIIKYKDGVAYRSYDYDNFGENEEVISFKDYKGSLYALISDFTADDGRLIRLDKINSGVEDTWTEVITTSDLDSAPEGLELFEDLLYIISDDEVWSWDNSLVASITSSIPAFLTSIYTTIYFKGSIYIFGSNGSSDYLYEYDGNTTFTLLQTISADMEFPSGYQPIGKKLMVEYQGKIYYYGDSYIVSYDIDTGIKTNIVAFTNKPTCFFIMEGIVFIAYANSGDSLNNIFAVVPDQFYKEQTLVAGEGKALESLTKVVSDPVFSIHKAKLDNITPYNKYPVVAVLGGSKNVAIKYGNRLEFYTDINDVEVFIEKNLKELMDDLTSITDSYFTVDGNNTATINRRDLVGYSRKWLTINDSSEYGQDYVKEIESAEKYKDVFKRITISWSNPIWKDNAPIAVGAVHTREFANLDYSSDLINDPILARNIALNFLDNMDVTEILNIQLAYSYFLEGKEVLSFNIENDDNVYIDEDREWKLVGVEHIPSEYRTNLVLLERTVTVEVSDI